MTAALCNAEGCLTYLGERMEDGLVTFDYGHLTPVASTFVAQHVLAPVIMSAFHREAAGGTKLK